MGVSGRNLKGQFMTRTTTTQPNTITIRKLRRTYGEHSLDVLDEYLEELDTEDEAVRTVRTYRIIKPLPSKDEFLTLQTTHYTSTVAELVGDAFGVFEDLACEMGDWYDNLPEGFQAGDKGVMLDDARNTLENLEQPEVFEHVATLKVLYLPLTGRVSRASRRDDAVRRLRAVLEVLVAIPPDDDTDKRDERQELINELENAIGDAEYVEFPGMY